jgi:arginyl-tRNA synthetase
MQLEINKLNKELRDQQGNIPFKLVSKLETNLTELVSEITEEFNEHETLIKKYKESQINLLDRKTLVKSLIQKTFKAIGQE